MGIPPIAPYPLRAAVTAPGDRVDWAVRPDRAVLLVHDMQNYFLSAFRPDQPQLPDVLANLEALRNACDAAGVPVVYTAQPGDQPPDRRVLLTDFWGPGLGGDPRDTAITARLAPRPGHRVLTKWRYSAFARTALEELLAGAGRDQLVVTGVYAHIGVLATACDAFMRDVQAFVVADAVADFSARHHRDALRWAAQRCAATTTTRRLLDTLGARP